MKRILKLALIIIGIASVVIQFFRPDRTNPPVDPTRSIFAVTQVPPDIAALLKNSCFDCHSNETHWPFYSNVAPASWLVADDVHEGRRHLNFSEWGTYSARKQASKMDKIRDEVDEGGMPLPKYLLLHGNAKLSAGDRKAIIDWAAKQGRGGDAEE